MARVLAFSLEECMSTFLTKPRPYQKTSIGEILDELKLGKDVALSLPTGTGKTYVYLPIAVTAANRGHRVCILVATNQIIEQMEQEYLPKFKISTKPCVVKGIEHYDCAITKDKADYGTCTPEQKEICISEYSDCDVLRVNKEFEEYGFILTNFHKFLSTKTHQGFDLVIIDDSHGFENALDDKFQSRMAYYQIDGLYKRHEQQDDLTAAFAGSFLDFFDAAINTIPPGPQNESMRAPNDVVKGIAEIEGYDELRDQLRKLQGVDRSVCRGLFYFVKCCQNTSTNTFYVQKDHYKPDDPQEAALIARKSDSFQTNVVKKIFGRSRVIFASATLGDLVTHAHYCTHREYARDTIPMVPKNQPAMVKNWFRGLEIFETSDFPQDKDDQVEEAAKMVAKILTGTQGKTLLLFKSYRDQNKAGKVLRESVSREITFIDDSDETETVQACVKKADVIMATASSRLWEGIDISDLKLEIIFSLPFIRPPVHLEKSYGFTFNKRKMLIRLQQGIGRLIRKENDRGVCIVMDNRLDKYKNSANFSSQYREKIRLVTTSQLLKELKCN